ncbi:hypothetical protein BU17DRAFT_64753 [Hysterangium stoloniferum]|nr:hypothetical protein BU17DRAFT_64753 [Hysterangium stoloniferum]
MRGQEDLHLHNEAAGPGGPLQSLQTTQADPMAECTSLDMRSAFFDPMRHRESVSSSSGSSIFEPDSPMCQRRSSTFSDAVEDDTEDAPWNLVAYHVPWGPGYEGYEAGTLPGPDGTCVFLRSPTPLKRQRTSQACDKCRERKAKCSGSRPSCTRCTDKGLSCFYSASPVIPDAPLPARALTRRLSVANSKEHLRLSTRNRMRRKSSPGEADHTIEGGSGMQVGNVFDASVVEPYGGQYDQGDFTQELQARSFSSTDQMPSALYAQPISTLDSYRFPPTSVEDMGEMAMSSTEQLQDAPQSKFFNEDSVLPEVPNSESQLWNHANGFFQSSIPRSDINFMG